MPVPSLFRLLAFLERAAAYLQGKGYGAATITQEVLAARASLGRAPILAIDVGGNVGDYAAELRRREAAVEIHIFEPSPTNVTKLRARFAADPLISVNGQALSDAAGPVTLFADEPGSGLGSLTQRKLDHFGIRFDRTERVEAIRFEDYWTRALGSRPIDIAKIDVEGHELAVLAGFGKALDATTVVQVEFGGCNIDTRTFFRDFYDLFREHGFDLHRVTPFGLQRIAQYREADEFFSTTNFIACRRAG